MLVRRQPRLACGRSTLDLERRVCCALVLPPLGWCFPACPAFSSPLECAEGNLLHHQATGAATLADVSIKCRCPVTGQLQVSYACTHPDAPEGGSQACALVLALRSARLRSTRAPHLDALQKADAVVQQRSPGRRLGPQGTASLTQRPHPAVSPDGATRARSVPDESDDASREISLVLGPPASAALAACGVFSAAGAQTVLQEAGTHCRAPDAVQIRPAPVPASWDALPDAPPTATPCAATQGCAPVLVWGSVITHPNCIWICSSQLACAPTLVADPGSQGLCQCFNVFAGAAR